MEQIQPTTYLDSWGREWIHNLRTNQPAQYRALEQAGTLEAEALKVQQSAETYLMSLIRGGRTPIEALTATKARFLEAGPVGDEP